MKLLRKFRRRGMLALFVGATSLAIVAVACSSSQPAAPTAPAPAAPAPAAPVPAAPTEQVMGAGQTLTILITNLGNGRFDTWLSDGEDLKFLRILNAPLVGGEGGGSLIPGTIKAWEMTADGKNWTFTVQDDFVTFHNGDKLTVDDVQWTVDKMLGQLAQELGHWEGSASDLLPVVSNRASERVQKHRSWPKTAIGLGSCLGRLAPALRKIGVDVRRERGGRDGGRLWIIEGRADV